MVWQEPQESSSVLSLTQATENAGANMLRRALKRALAVAGAALAVMTASLTLTSTKSASAYTDKVENACRADYFRHCAGYPVGSASLRLCMESKSKQLSPSCVTALVDAGLVDRRRMKRGY